MCHFIATRGQLFLRGSRKRTSRRGYASAVIASTTVAIMLGAPLASAQAAPTFQFAAKTDFATGAKPQAVAVGDLNGDGKSDLVVANTEANTVSVLLGKGDGTFAAKVDYPTGTAPTAVAIADVNGDKKPDLIVANSATGTVSVLLGKGDGTFEPKADYPTGAKPQSVAVGDLNGDGKLDLAVANTEANTVSVLLGKGDGTFEPSVEYSTGTAPTSVAIGDFNGDKKLDLVTANSTANTVSVLLGKGDGTFEPKVDYPTATGPTSVAVGDLNGDGKSDLAVANNGSSSVSVLLGKGDGTFASKADYPTGTAPTSVAIGDLNADKKLDLVTANSTANTISVLLGKGDGTFAVKQDLATGTKPQAVAVGDLNGDGKPDLVSANSEASTVSVLLNTSVPTLETSAISAFSGQLFGTKSTAKKVTVTNGGSATLAVSTIAVSGNFSVSGCAGTSLAPGANCSISVVFAPKGYGKLTGTLTIASNAPTASIALSGTGLPPAAIVTTTPVENIFGSYVTLAGSVLSQGPGSFHFEYGGTKAYGSVTPSLLLASSSLLQFFGVSIALTPGATYHYRIVASNLVGTVAGADQVFTIPPDPPLLALVRRHGRLHLASVLKHGLPLRVGDSSTSTITLKISVDASTARSAHLISKKRKSKARVTIGTAKIKVRGSATRTFKAQITAKLRRRLAALGQLKLAIDATASTPTGVVGSPTKITVNLRR
jgi:FG-GAP-like repeat/FG-GAP repeat/Abnormal spindle-like microcephaly-assoc'd, ASPM-SPD-2-Hydin